MQAGAGAGVAGAGAGAIAAAATTAGDGAVAADGPSPVLVSVAVYVRVCTPCKQCHKRCFRLALLAKCKLQITRASTCRFGAHVCGFCPHFMEAPVILRVQPSASHLAYCWLLLMEP